MGQVSQSQIPLRGANSARFIPLQTSARAATHRPVMALNGGKSDRVWKLKDLKEVPRVAKSDTVPDDVKLAMATGRVPDRSGEGSRPLTADDREMIAAALAPVVAEPEMPLGEILDPESLETDLDIPQAIAKGMAQDEHRLAADEGANDPRFVWPVAEDHTRISSPYGFRKHPVTGKKDFHAGIDIPAPQGTAVLAAMDGEVAGVGEHPRLGRYVKVTHADGTYSLYGHLQKWTTRTGAAVRAGEKIGQVGSTGRSTGPHLDFSIRRDGKPINPMTVLAGALAEKKLASSR